jgi:hypothetical protein
VVDDYSRYAWVFFIEDKGETFGFVRDLVLRLRNERHGDAVRAIRSDNGSEFRNSRFETFCHDLGLCWGKRPSEALSTSGQTEGFGSRAASATRGSFRNAGLTKTLMLLELCEFCCAGAAHLSSAGLRCRRHGQLCYGAEGLKEPEALCVDNTSARGWRRHGRDVPRGTTRPGRGLGLFRCRRCGVLRHVAAANV